MKNLCLFVFCILGLMSCPCSAFAYFDGAPNLPDLVQKADAICIVKVVNIKQIVPIKFEAVHKDKNGLPVLIDAKSAVAEVVVQNVLKGSIAQKSIEVAFFENVSRGFNPTPFTELVVGETDIVFLKTAIDGMHFSLSQPSSHGKSKIVISDAINPAQGTGSPLRAVLSALVDALTNGNNLIKLECLNRIGSVGYLLYTKPDVYSEQGSTETRNALNEALLTDKTVDSSLERFVSKEILPAVKRLTKDTDVAISEQATITAGELQDVSVIPNLIKISSKDTDPDVLGLAALTIGEYKNPKAIIPLIEALNSSSSKVREQAVYSLRELNNPLALPFLIERLNDGASSVRFAANQALFGITGEVGSHLSQDNKQSLQTRENAFWKNWALEHQDKLKKYRVEFDFITQTVVP